MSKMKKKNSSDDIQLTLDKCLLDIQEIKEKLEIKDKIIIDQAGTIELLKKRLNQAIEENDETQERMLNLTPGVIDLERENKSLRPYKKFNKKIYSNDGPIFSAAMKRYNLMQGQKKSGYNYKTALEEELIARGIDLTQDEFDIMDNRFRQSEQRKKPR